MGKLIRHPSTLQSKRKKLEERKLLIEQMLKECTEPDIQSKLLSENLWLHGVIAGLTWALGEGDIDNLFEDLLPRTPVEDTHGKPGKERSEVRPPDSPQEGGVHP